jgi:hypothetical protein
MQDEGGQALGKGARASGPLPRGSSHVHNPRPRLWCAALCAVVGGLLTWGASAQAALVHPYVSQLSGPPGEPFVSLCGVGVDPGNGEVYVPEPAAELKEESKPAIDVFGSISSGSTFIGLIDKGVGAEFAFHEACSTAVNDVAQHIYVTNNGEQGEVPEEDEKDVVFVYTPAAGKFKFEKKLTLDGSSTPQKSFQTGPFEAGGPLHVAVAQASGTLYVSVAEQGVIDEFDATGKYLTQLTLPAGPGPQSIATDSSGDLYAVVELSEQGQSVPVIDEFNASGMLLKQITGASSGGFGRLTGIAVDSGGHIYVSDAETRAIDEYDSAGDFMGRMTGSGSPAGSFAEPTGVAINAEADVYVADQAGGRRASFPSVVDVFGPATTGAGPFLENAWVSGVKSTAATLEAQIDPTGVHTTYQFEYTAENGPEAGVTKHVPEPEGDVGSGESIQHVEAKLQGLTPSTTYSFRATIDKGAEQGALQTFTTLPEGVESGLPDGRAWELVSPANKLGALITPIGAPPIQAAADGGGITYAASSPIEHNPESNAGEAQVLSTRSSGTWTSRQINPPDYPPTGIPALFELENQIFSADLSRSIVDPYKEEPPLSEDASERTTYVHDLSHPCHITERTCYRPLVTAKGELANVESQIKFGGEGISKVFGEVRPAAATPDLSHVILKSEVPLKLELNKQAVEGAGLYEWSEEKLPAERLQLVSVLPGGKPANGFTEKPHLGAEENGEEDVRNAISADGKRVVWQTHIHGEHHLYVRDTEKEQTVQLDEVSGGSGEGEHNAVFQTATANGSMVFFTDEEKLTSDSTASAGKPDLYVCQLDPPPGESNPTPLGCKLTDLTGNEVVGGGESADVQGLLPGLGQDEEGISVYFVANGVASTVENGQNEKATPGACSTFPAPTATCNLYVRHFNANTGWQAPTFIAVLSSGDAPDWGGRMTPGKVESTVFLERLTSRVSPNGKYLAFMSDRRLTKFDNTDASKSAGGAADEEVFVYGAGGNQLVCASCNRYGQRPHGVFDAPPNTTGVGELIDRQGNWTGRWLAANVPGWTERSGHIANYQSRYLSNSGRLFFNSSDTLVPADKNLTEDVYQFEPNGVGSCAAGPGCIALISSGESQEESAFLDASESGDDVFFLTAAKLVPQDVDQSIDVYDAHVCTTGLPCPAPPPQSSTCSSSTSCQGASSQQTGFGSPASATLSGSGNIQAQGVLPIKVTKLTRAQQLAKALKACRKLKRKNRRLACERSARKKYGPKKTSKGAKKSSRRAKTGGK